MLRAFVYSILFLLIASETYAAFTLYLKDGTSMEVSRITFKRDKAEVYPVGGAVRTIPWEAIDFDATGIERPTAAVGTTIYGTSKATKSADTFSTEGTQKSTQNELEAMWNSTDRTAVAIKDYATIRERDELRVIWNDVYTFKILSRGPDGTLNMTIVDATTFFETFSSTAERQAYDKRFGPYHVENLPAAKPLVEPVPVEEPVDKEESIINQALKRPFVLGVGVLIVLGLLLALSRGRR